MAYQDQAWATYEERKKEGWRPRHNPRHSEGERCRSGPNGMRGPAKIHGGYQRKHNEVYSKQSQRQLKLQHKQHEQRRKEREEEAAAEDMARATAEHAARIVTGAACKWV